MFLKPKTIRTGESLGKLDIAIRRPNSRQRPTELTMVYIENGEAKVAIGSPSVMQYWDYQYSLGPAIDAAIEYDGRWTIGTDDKYTMITIGDPWIFRLTPSGSILAQQGQSSSPFVVASGNITAIAAIRGWKNVTGELTDQGIIVAFIKDSKVYYRAYCEQLDGTKKWEQEFEVTALGSDNKQIALYRTNDYRTLFITSKLDGNIAWAATRRAWAGIALSDELIGVSGASASATLTPVTYYDAYGDRDVITLSMDAPIIRYLYATSPVIVSAKNPEDSNVYIEMKTDEELFNIENNKNAFTITDEEGVTLVSTDIVKVNKNTYILTFPDFHNYIGYLDLANVPSGIVGEAGQAFDVSTVRFIPTGLVHDPEVPPIPINIYNEEVL